MPPCALITGCSAGGIGSALVTELHAQGFKIYATARSTTKMNHLSALPNVTLIPLDVTNKTSITGAVNTIHQDLTSHNDTLTLLINNAGQSLVAPALDTPIDESKRLFEVNFWGVIAVAQAFIPLLLHTKNEGSTIVNVCSISGFLYAPWMSTYNATKSALYSWSETLRLELQPFNIRVISLVTGTIATNIMSHTNISLPENSLYQKALPEIQTRGVGKDIRNKTPPGEFAREVVRDILRGATGPVWRGSMAWVVRVMGGIVPVGVLDWVLKKGTGLDRLP
ncbi:NAD(P)-binding protein [Aspergillus sclerotioniger CBS 115572]|uniref:NAD(P)-binding protein n=1 Tax=Aspergillus sclerotioniger CBS 115572 TaxID=1450535 RepID=A0A317W2S4_9EURO|nr:NAD(P)-binding protein [Aspergillus sclerotioniger CBS 115572]PWY80783.1 NAD(P)-binding protein [Aspergillus sclerotioniger CBS 115572]